MSLLQMSISAAVMISIITVIRAISINRLPKKTFIALWGIVLVRLLVPFSWPSPLSVYSLANRPEVGQIGGAPVTNVLPIVPTSTAPTDALTAGISPWAWIWGIGLALCVLYFAIAYIRCCREFMTSQPVENAFTVQWLTTHNCKRPVTIRQTDSITAPLTYGIFRPVILMPIQTDWTDTKKLQYVLEHEYVHIRRFDGVTKFLLTVALCTHWFNPLVWVMYILANRDIELSCDEKVVRIFGETVKSVYALILIDMAEKKSGLVPLCNHFSKNAIEERIEAIMKIKKTTVFTLVIACAVVVVVGSTFATSASELSTSKGLPAVKDAAAVCPDSYYAYKFLPDPDIYAKYSSYGIDISDDGERLLYNGQRVRVFIDERSDAETFFLDESGTLDLSVIRNAAGNVTGIESISVYKAQEYLSDFFAGDANPNVVVREIEQDMVHEIERDITGGNKFKQYSAYGIVPSEDGEVLYHNGQRVKLLVDRLSDGNFETFWSDDAGTDNLSVLRNSTGQITSIEQLSEKQAWKYRSALDE